MYLGARKPKDTPAKVIYILSIRCVSYDTTIYGVLLHCVHATCMLLGNIVGNTYKYINCKYKLSQGMLSNFNIPLILMHILRFSYSTEFNSYCPIVWYIMLCLLWQFSIHKSLAFVLLSNRDVSQGLPTVLRCGYRMPSGWFDVSLYYGKPY